MSVASLSPAAAPALAGPGLSVRLGRIAFLALVVLAYAIIFAPIVMVVVTSAPYRLRVRY